LCRYFGLFGGRPAIALTIKTDGFHFLLYSCDEAVHLVRQSTFHMDDDGDLQEQILHLEAQIEELADVIERCRKIILISKAAIAAGGALILGMIIGAIGFDPTVMIGAIATAIGGIVVFGSNTATLKQTTTAMKAAEAHRAELINRMDLRVVDGEIEVNEMRSSGSGHQSF
jgi:hypothetical protein